MARMTLQEAWLQAKEEGLTLSEFMKKRKEERAMAKVVIPAVKPTAEQITKAEADFTSYLSMKDEIVKTELANGYKKLDNHCYYRHNVEFGFHAEGINYYGGPENNVAARGFEGIIVSLNNSKYARAKSIRVTKERGMDILVDLGTSDPDVYVDWPDYGTPPVQPAFWAALHKLAVERDKDVLFYCTGGHGRTGTALAAMMIAVNGADSQQAIDFIRTQICQSAVENIDQELYLDALDSNLNGDD